MQLYNLFELVSLFGGRVEGGEASVQKVASLENANEKSLSFFTNSKYAELLSNSKAAAIILTESNAHLTKLPKIITDNPYAYFAKVSAFFNPPRQYPFLISPSSNVGLGSEISESCYIAPTVVIGDYVKLGSNVVIGPGAVLGDHVEIGCDTRIDARVVIYDGTIIGKNCHISAGAVIGADGFGYAFESNQWIKIPQVGKVIIGDSVDIGVNTSIDRGALDDTVIEEGVKIDNLVQIGHNCVIGAHTVIAGCAGVAGSAKIGKFCRIGGAAMILGHLEIADKVTISPGSMITRSIKQSGTYTALMPFQDHNNWLKTAASVRHLTDLADKVKCLENELKSIKLQQDKTEKN